MDYTYETLNDVSFQKLCQALLCLQFPNVQCLPTGQPDGGRDAILKGDGIAFQVKFSKNPSLKTEREAVESLIKTESKKVKELVKKGFGSYYFLTNVIGTSHPEVGSIDRVNALLTAEFGIPSFCWWRDDLDRRLDAAGDLKWRYPQITTGQDVLQLIAVSQRRNMDAVLSAFKKYVAKQYVDDEEVKFQQVQIQSNILDLFVDIPVGRSRKVQPKLGWDDLTLHDPRQLFVEYENEPLHVRGRPTVLAASWLLSTGVSGGVQRLVLEGAPGQGKSTVTQYVCQVHRMRLLDRSEDIARVADQHRNSHLRLPFRVDLRDYALWLNGFNPNTVDQTTPRPQEAVDGLESFLSFQVRTLSGGMAFDELDFSSLSKDSHLIVVLDGFDEVADLKTRGRLLTQIRDFAARLEVNAQSVQVVVTSRPAAFALSAGFPEREWAHFSLLAMDHGQIKAYADKWVAAKAFGPRDAADFQTVLMDRINQPHIRSLAQNPMQLAILLTLISTKGRALPDKRTALYDSYMDLFFGREAEKDVTVRNNRDLLIKLHQYIAWILHTEAEAAKSAGSVSKERLQNLVREYITFTGHRRRDVEQLFTGVLERVGALVSRVQGTYEFEVQPLREYFAGRYLYESAPYSPTGDEKGGTKPDRFAAMCRNAYWLNTVRFYCGCYSSGELASLVDGLAVLTEKEPFALLSRSRQLAVMLLSDYVFSQEPRAVQNVVALILERRGWYLLLSQLTNREQFQVSLPEEGGRDALIGAAEMALLSSDRYDETAAVAQILRANMHPRDRKAVLLKILEVRKDDAWTLGGLLGTAETWTHEDIRRLHQELGPSVFELVAGEERWDLIDEDLLESALCYYLDQGINAKISLYNRVRFVTSPTPLDQLITIFALLSTPYLLSQFPKDAPLRHAISRMLPISDYLERDRTDSSPIKVIVDVFNAQSRQSLSVWQTDLAPWNSFVEATREHFGDRWALRLVAVTAAGIRSSTYRSSGYNLLNDANSPLCERARAARLKSGNARWWVTQLDGASSSDELQWVLLNLFAWGSESTLASLHGHLSNYLDGLDEPSWQLLVRSVRFAVMQTGDSRRRIKAPANVELASKRFALLVALRATEAGARLIWELHFRDYTGSDREMLEFIESFALDLGGRSQRMWPLVLPIVRDSFKKLGRHKRQQHYVSSNARMATKEAQEVCRNPELYPLAIVTLAEANLARSAQRAEPRIGRIAEENDWFPEHKLGIQPNLL